MEIKNKQGFHFNFMLVGVVLSLSGTLYTVKHNDSTRDFAPMHYTYTLIAPNNASGIKEIQVAVDGADYQVYQEAIEFTTEGEHTLTYRAVDNLGNWEEEKTFTVTVDGTPPETTLDVSEPKCQLDEGLSVAGTTVFSLTATDLGQIPSGLQWTEYRINEGFWTRYKEPFVLEAIEDGSYTIEYRSVDNVNNVEKSKSITIILDKTTPKVEILSPQEEEENVSIYVADTYNSRIQKFNLGKTPIVNGIVSIIGTVGDIHFRDYNLEYSETEAPGTWTQMGKIQTEQLKAGTLGRWDTAGLSGVYTIKLTAVDSVGNTSIDTVTVLIGEPEFNLRFGNLGTGPGELILPINLTIDKQGYIYVTDTMNHRIQKFDVAGNFILGFGQKSTKGPELRQGEFNQPESVAIDSQGNIYVADRYNHRIQKFDKDGNYLMEFGSKGNHGDGKFDQPAGIAFDSKGNIHVADTRNHRIQKFDKDGNFLMKFGTKGEAEGKFNHPVAIDIDNKDNIYILDRYNYRIQKFDKYGNFLMQFGAEGSARGELELPHDLCLDSKGNIYVADEHNNRIFKFDPYGNILFVFGQQGSGEGDFKLPCGITVGPTELPEPEGQTPIAEGVDLKISSLVFSKTNPAQGDKITITIEAVSLYADAENVIVRFYDGDSGSGGKQIGSDEVIEILEKDELKTLQITRDTTDFEGDCYIYCCLDPDNNITESNEDNNVLYEKIFVASSKFNIDINTDKKKYKSGKEVVISLTLSNIGPATETGLACQVNIKDETGNLIAELTTIEIDTLIPDEIAFYTPIWDSRATEEGDYQAEAILKQAGKDIVRASAVFSIR